MEDRTKPTGAYMAQVVVKCEEHGQHVCTLASEDDMAWLMADALICFHREALHFPSRAYKWRSHRPWQPIEVDQIDGDAIEDDIPF